MAKILLVEDDDKIATALLDLWRSERFVVDRAACLADAALFLERFGYDIIVLDWELPDGQGVSLLSKLARHKQRPPVIMLTARGATADKVSALDGGADDYLAKPFEFEELSARLRALLKREKPASPAYLLNEISVDPLAHKVFVGAQELRLAPRDFQLLKRLVESGGAYITQDALQREVFGSALADSKNALLCSVSRLRSSLKKSGASATIEFCRQSGYRLIS